MKKALGLSIAATMGIGCLSLTPAANAGQTLWDQPPITDIPAFKDQRYADFPDFSTFLVVDVVFDTGVKISSITTYFTNGNLGWPQNADGFATLNIFADPLSNADDNPLDGRSVPVFLAVTDDGLSATASGLNIDLAAGTYWIGLTPEVTFVQFGNEFHWGAASIGNATQGRNPGDGFGLGTDWFDAGATFGGIEGWDAAITIEGIPAPGVLALLGVAGLVTRRRRSR